MVNNSLLHHTLFLCATTQNQRRTQSTCSYQQGTTVLCFKEEAHQPTSLQVLFSSSGDTEGSQNSEGSHETGDSGRYSHDEMEMTDLSSGQGSLISINKSKGSLFSPSSGPGKGDEHLSSFTDDKHKSAVSVMLIIMVTDPTDQTLCFRFSIISFLISL